jgi:hypothetical protein
MPFVKKKVDEDDSEGDDDVNEDKLARMMGGTPKLDDDESPADEESSPAEEEAFESNSIEYAERIQIALQYLSDRPDEFLVPEKLKEFSPKFTKILENIMEPANVGLHLLYSQFRTVEGIGLLKIILEANGYAQFKIHKKSANESKRTNHNRWN